MGMLTVSPLADPGNYDVAVIAGIRSPGICEVTGANRKFIWDEKQTAGAQGATITYRGWALAKPKIKFKLWTDALIRQFYDEFVPALAYDATKQSPKPVDVYHPKLFANDIFWLVTQDIGDLTDEGAQLWTVTVEFLEYRQAKANNTTTTPTTANNSGTGNSATKPSVEDELDQETSRLLNEWKKPF